MIFVNESMLVSTMNVSGFDAFLSWLLSAQEMGRLGSVMEGGTYNVIVSDILKNM